MAQLKNSERRLLLIFGIILFGLVAYLSVEYVIKRHKFAKSQHDILSTQLAELEAKEQRIPEWTLIRDWLDSKQPYPNPEISSQELLDNFVAGSIRSQGLEEINRAYRDEVDTPHYHSVSMSATVKGDLESIRNWLYTLQEQDKFRAVTKCEISPDRKDPTIIKADVILEWWLAPGSSA
ncbi:MAG: hypothetical protein AAF514_19810 [Verrucomicrobiota bacterium]